MITSMANPRVKLVRELLAKPKVRRREGCFVAEGIRMVAETPEDMLAGLFVSESFLKMTDRHRGLKLDHAEVLSDSVFRQLSDTQTPQGILAVVRQQLADPESLLGGKDPLLMFLENIQDPGNLGTIIRTAEGAGVTGIIMSAGTVDVYNPKTVRATMGSLYRMPLAVTDDLAGMIRLAAEAGIKSYAAYLGGSVDYAACDYRQGTAFLIGNEGNGLTQETAAAADVRVHIPMAGSVESLNAAVAAAVLMYEASRQRR